MGRAAIVRNLRLIVVCVAIGAVCTVLVCWTLALVVDSSGGRALGTRQRDAGVIMQTVPLSRITEERGLPVIAMWHDRTGVGQTSTPRSSADVVGGLDLGLPPFASNAPRILPVFIRWSGFLINTLFYAALAWCVLTARRVLRRRIRRWAGWCVECGYHVRDLERCPECAAPPAPPIAPPSYLRRGVIALIVGVVVNVLVAWTCACVIDIAGLRSGSFGHIVGEETTVIVRGRVGLGSAEYLFTRRPAEPFDSQYGLPRGMRLDLRRMVVADDVLGYAEGRGWPALSMGRAAARETDTGLTLGLTRPGGRDVVIPLRPLWVGFFLNTLVYALIGWFIVWTWEPVQGRLARRWRLCPACRRDLDDEGVCDSCGASADIAWRRVALMARRARRPIVLLVAATALTCIVAFTCVLWSPLVKRPLADGTRSDLLHQWAAQRPLSFPIAMYEHFDEQGSSHRGVGARYDVLEFLGRAGSSQFRFERVEGGGPWTCLEGIRWTAQGAQSTSRQEGLYEPRMLPRGTALPYRVRWGGFVANVIVFWSVLAIGLWFWSRRKASPP
jgi:hypothetical protein